jgi:predicted phage baseplate assembly protein
VAAPGKAAAAPAPAIYTVQAAGLAGGEDFGITARTTRVTLDTSAALSNFDRRQAVVHTQSERLLLVDDPIPGTVEGNQLELDRVVPLAPGATVFVAGITAAGVRIIRLATVESVGSGVAGTTLTLDADLPPKLRRDSVRVLGNVVPATHGETVDEVLGSGDGTLNHQRFTLRKPELTHVSARTANGVRSTLEVRVDDVLWAEVSSLFLAGPHDRVYVVRIGDDARATVVFGDGVRGARLPTGQENVLARYRSGIGPAGRVAADSLSLLPQRPFGIATVTNPLPAAGGVAPEKLDDARVNAPLTVLTLDRIVSLRDHEDFARAFGGIAKAHAVALPVRTSLLVHLTVAAAGGAAAGGAAVDDTTVDNLRDAIAEFGGEADRLRVDSVQPTPFEVGVAVLADPARVRSTVDDAVTAALRATFAVDRRSFAQPVTAAEVIAAVQAVPGVVAATLTELHRRDGTGVQDVLVARDARLDPQNPDRIVPAELLVVDPDAIRPTVMPP